MTVRRSTIVAGLFAATLLTGWGAGATWLILTKDSFAGHMIKRETARQYVYEDRIAALKSEIDKLSSRQLVDQDGVEARVAELVTRQSQLETRQSIVAALAYSVSGQQLATGRPARNAIAPQPAATANTTGSISSFAPSSRPMPVPDMPGLRRDQEQRATSASAWDQSALDPSLPIADRLGKIEQSLTEIGRAHV